MVSQTVGAGGIHHSWGSDLTTLHYTAGDNFDAQGNYAPAAAGFNLADVSSVDQLNALPAGVQGMVYLDQGDGVTQSFIDAVKPYIGNPKVYGFYLKDEPDPTGQYNTLVTAANLKAESDYIHANVPGAKTFITMMNMGSSEDPTFANTYNPANTHIDLFGIDPYPVRSDGSTVDYGMIDKAVAAAESAGIPTSQIVPVFQTFGGGNWVNDSGGHYVMPTAAQEQTMLAHWATLVPSAAFDYAYAWGSQNGDTALESSPELQSVFLQHNTSGATLPVEGTGVITTGTPGQSAIPPTDSSGQTTTSSNGGTNTAAGDGVTVDSGATTGSSGVSTSSGSTSTTIDGGQYHQHHHQQHNAGASAALAIDATGGASTGGSSETLTPTTGWSGNAYTAARGGAISNNDSTSSGSAATVIDGGQYRQNHQSLDHHQSLDFSQLTVGGTGGAVGGHSMYSALSAAATGSGTTDAASTALTDGGGHLADPIGLHSDYYTSHHIDHHAWHL